MSSVRRGTALAAALTTAAAGAIVVSSAAGASPVHADHSAKIPTITVTGGKTLHYHGPSTVQAGRVRIVLAKGTAALGVIHLRKGLTFANYRAARKQIDKELQTNPKQGLRDLRAALKLVVFEGGLQGPASTTKSMTVVLTKGVHFLYSDAALPKQPFKIRVVAPAQRRPAPSTAATVAMRPGNQFGGAKVLPHAGTIRVINNASNSPHFLILQHVKQGTTRKQIEDYFASGGQGAPKFALRESTSTDALNPHHSQTFTYRLPRGEYVELCFFPDPQTGMPHAFMGMFRIVTLK